MPYVEYSRPMIQYTCSLDINSAFTNLPIAMAMTSSDTWHSIRHRLFPIGGPLEPSLYLYRFLEILGPKHFAIS